MFDPKLKSRFIFKLLSWIQIVSLAGFFTLPSGLAQAQTFSVFSLPKPGQIVTTSEKFNPLLIKGISLHPENPLVFDFILDPGDTGYSDDQIKAESQRLIKYFFASLTVPENDLWVNLSPYEKDRIIPEAFGQTEMGRDLLAQDYILKQLSASLIYPEKDFGKDFWNRVYKKAKELYGTTDIPVNTFNKVWIVPGKATIVESKTSAYITQSTLKVLLEEDYVSLNKNRANEVLGTTSLQEQDVKKVSNMTSAIVRDIILPEIEREINEGKNFAQLRQVYASLLLATWFKINLRDNILNQIYSNQNKVLGVNLQDKTDKDKIYKQYIAAFREGVFNYIKEDVDETTKEIIPRKYFSGGFDGRELTISFDNGDVQRLPTDSDAGKKAISEATPPGGDIVVTTAASRTESTNTERMSKALADLQSLDSDVRMKAIQVLELIGDESVLKPLTELRDITASQVTASAAAQAETVMISRAIEIIQERIQQLAIKDGEKAISSVSPEDFQELVGQRDRAEAGFHKNVNPTRVVPASEEAVENLDVRTPEERQRLIAKEQKMYDDGKVVMIVMAGGEATRFGGPKTFKPVSDELGEFLEIKAANLRWLRQRFGSKQPMFVMTSQKRIGEFKRSLYDRGYYGLTQSDFQLFTQGTIDTFIPTDEEIREQYKGNQAKIDDAIAKAKRLRELNPDGIYRFNGQRRFVPPGHLDTIVAFIVSGRLSDALSRGAEFAEVFNIDNLQAVVKNDGMMARFSESGNDFQFLLAEKNLAFDIVDTTTGKTIVKKMLVRFRDNVISFDGIAEFQGQAEKDGFKFVINRVQRTVDVFDADNNKLSVKITIKPETGGTLVQPVDESGNPLGKPIMREGFELRSDFDHANAPFFNTNTILVKLESLLRLLGVSQEELARMSLEERSALVREKIVKQVKANFEFKKDEVQGEYPDLGDVKDGKTKIEVSQLTRIMLQVAHLPDVNVGYFYANRNEIFAPVKEPEDTNIAASNNRESLGQWTVYDNSWKNQTTPSRLFPAVVKVDSPEVGQGEVVQKEGERQDPPGGIDFNPDNIKMEVNKQNGGINIEFDPKILDEIRSQGIEGLIPVILNIQRVQSVVPLLSRVDEESVNLVNI